MQNTFYFTLSAIIVLCFDHQGNDLGIISSLMFLLIIYIMTYQAMAALTLEFLKSFTLALRPSLLEMSSAMFIMILGLSCAAGFTYCAIVIGTMLGYMLAVFFFGVLTLVVAYKGILDGKALFLNHPFENIFMYPWFLYSDEKNIDMNPVDLYDSYHNE